MLKAEGIEKSYGALKVLRGVNIEVKKGEVVSIVGASGAGKSTLLHILGTLDAADKGKIFINEMETGILSGKKLSTFRNTHIGFVFQFHHLLPEFTALENVCLQAYIGGKKKKETENKAKELFGMLNLIERAEHLPGELSGGEQQRIAVARALINNPTVVLADEPSGNLDSQNAETLHQLFFDLRKKLNQTFIIATHNEKLAAMADRKLVMQDGLFI
ncbi:MAG TPA: ABC transporter ATP-binding protein [Bacteroidia bacterium]|nr:ABC transporter ATP-binding protein [Bacteroidia bacterium]